jgi:hypothetical protein
MEFILIHVFITFILEENSRPIRQPQRCMNPILKEIVKEELQKLLNVNFIYPISDSQWVSPLVIVPKKNGKWCVCIDYRELNKATLKYHFPLPFIDQVLDTLVGKNIFLFLMGLAVIIKFKSLQKIRIKPHSHAHGGHMLTEYYLLGYAMLLLLFNVLF